MNWQLKLDKEIYKERLRIYNLGFRKEKKKRAKKNQRYFKTQESDIEDEFWNRQALTKYQGVEGFWRSDEPPRLHFYSVDVAKTLLPLSQGGQLDFKP